MKPEPFHQKVATFGILASPKVIHVLAMTTTIEGDCFSYHLHHLGNFAGVHGKTDNFKPEKLAALLFHIFKSFPEDKLQIESYLVQSSTSTNI